MTYKTQYLNTITLVGIMFAITALSFGLAGFVQEHNGFDLRSFLVHVRQLNYIHGNLSFRLFIIAFGIIFVGTAIGNEQRTQWLKKRLVCEARSSRHDVAVGATIELRRRGWLTGENGILAGAPLASANLGQAFLGSASLQCANLTSANLKGTDLLFANLKRAMLISAQLQGAGLTCSDMEDAILTKARLEGASLMHANLEGATLVDAQLDEHTILPDGMKWSPDTDLGRYTDPDHSAFWRPAPGSVWWYPRT